MQLSHLLMFKTWFVYIPEGPLASILSVLELGKVGDDSGEAGSSRSTSRGGTKNGAGGLHEHLNGVDNHDGGIDSLMLVISLQRLRMIRRKIFFGVEEKKKRRL